MLYGHLFLKESKDKSILIDDFKTDNSLKFKIIDLNDKRLFNQKCIKDDEILYNNLNYRIEKGKIGEVAIESKSGEFAGYVCINKDGVLAPLYVVTKYRGHGLSKILVKDAINKYDAKKLGVYTDNEVAIKLYKYFGFKITGSKKYNDGTKIYIMEL